MSTPTVTEPSPVYAEWTAKPANPGDLPEDQYEKYAYTTGETLKSIARIISLPERDVTGDEIANLNWGTSDEGHVNYYLKNNNGCRPNARGTHYELASDDTQAWLWVPKVEPPTRIGKFRSPGKEDVGHIAPDDAEDETHINTLRVPPVYAITLQLGDIDALFDPLEETGKKPWECKGIQQRLQVLGYLYAPLTHAKINQITKRVWEHYMEIHQQPGDPEPAPGQWLAYRAILKEEVRNNLLCKVDSVPTESGKIYQGGLPRKGQFAMIRLPGGYAVTKSHHQGDYQTDASFHYEIGHDRWAVEDDCMTDNPLMHKLPLVARVHRLLPDGSRVPARNVSVYFQLVKPDDLPDANPLRAPDARATLMAYDQDWDADPGPFEVGDAAAPRGQRKFINDAFDAQDPVEDDDPRKDNVDKKYGGKRGIAVEGVKAGGVETPGVFEVGITRVGLHSRRSQRHADYGDLTAATKVEPRVDATTAPPTTRHAYSVRAKTNEKGFAGVVFMPSRCGGDKYKLRAYVGPESLEFAGDNEDGPVVETGTMVVWRNLRLYKYWRRPTPASNAVHADVSEIYASGDPWGSPLTDYVPAAGAGAQFPKVDITDAGSAEAVHSKTDFWQWNDDTGAWEPSDNYRSVDHRPIGVIPQYKQAYCEMIVDAPGRDPEDVPEDEWQKALDAAIKATSDNYPKRVDWDEMIVRHPSPHLFSLQHWKRYNKRIQTKAYPPGTSKPPDMTPADLVAFAEAIGYYGAGALMMHLAGGGVLPGFTIVQTLADTPWDNWGVTTVATSGLAAAGRATILSYSKATYEDNFSYSISSNAVHELSHALLRTHQPPNPGGDGDSHQTQCANAAAPGADECVCVMSYMGCYGELCGRCLLALRGLKTRSGTCADGI